MSRQAIESFLRTIIDKPSFAAQVGSDASILNGYDLTGEEKTALRRQDRGALRAMGVSPDLFPGLDALRLPDDTA